MLNTMLRRQDAFDSLARELFDAAARGLAAAPASPAAPRRWPSVNMWREGDDVVAEAELPGFTMDDVEVLVAGDALTVRGRRAEQTPEDAAPLRIERSIHAFERTLTLPVEIDADRAAAKLEHGVLRITLPLAEAARPKRIEITGEARPTEALPSSAEEPSAAPQNGSAG